MVPINLDALYLGKDRSVVEAMADFSRLPYAGAERDINSDVANISEEIVSKPFNNENLMLKAGIHLHWALPDALTQGTHASGSTDFPAVPNRWLIIRGRSSDGGSITDKSWIVESDYLFPEGATSASGISYPFSADPDNQEFQPFRYLGRKMVSDAWGKDDTEPEYLDKLTAVGYGEPSFAAFYPNCHSVFGFFDEEYAVAIPDGLQYDVIGWYANEDDDYLSDFIKDQTGNNGGPLTTAQLTEALEQEPKWTVSLGEDDEFPTRMVCYARLVFNPPSSDAGNPAVNSADMTISVGNTGTEALSAYLAQNVDSDRKATIEDQLESLQLSSRLENHRIDVGPKFREARHEKSFTSVVASHSWAIKLDTDDSSPADAEGSQAQAQVPFPDHLAGTLNDLNRLQDDYDQGVASIESMRKQLFSDWYKYMISAYPPEDSRDDYPDIDEVRHFIEVKGIAPLNDKISAVGSCEIEMDDASNVVKAFSDASADSLGARLAKSINDLIKAVKEYYQVGEEATPVYRLKLVSGQRHWQPNEPVLLMVGPAVKPTPRHGQDGSNNEDGLLECQIFANAEIETLIPYQVDLLVRWLDDAGGSVGDDAIGFSNWEQQPWNPFLLEWEVEIFPVKSRSNHESETGDYFTDFITSNFVINENEPEISAKEGKGGIATGANVYNGSSILTHYASDLLQDHLEDYLAKTEEYLEEEIPLQEYYKAKGVPESDQTGDYFSQNTQAVLDWYLETYCSGSSSDLCNTILAYENMSRAYELLTAPDFYSLSQSMGGFNEALIQHKQTTQLSIADPIGFDEYKSFANSVSRAVEDFIKSAPEPLTDYNPIRSGAMKIHRLRLVDTFGQVKDLDCSTILTTEGLKEPSSSYLVSLAPRLIQAARLNLRWLSAGEGVEEMDEQPESSPICGWILANNLDNSLMVYDDKGDGLGVIEMVYSKEKRIAGWAPFPGDDTPVSVDQIANPYLRRVVNDYILGEGAKSETFLSSFIAALDSAMENIEPESFAQHQELAVLMGRPVALVRASVSLELQGQPAIDQGWDAFRQDMARNTRETRGFTRVEFPIRLGEYRQLNDGLVGYWVETGEGSEANTFFSPQADSYEEDSIKTHADNPMTIYQSAESPPQVLSMLIDPRAEIHATSGILPAKAISVPADQYKPALQAIAVTFLSTPILVEAGKIRLPLPTEAGFKWSWLQKVNGAWSETSSTGTTTKQVFLDAFKGQSPDGEAVWARLVERQWIVKLTVEDSQSATTRASVVPKDQRTQPDLGEDFAGILPAIEDILEKSHIGKVNTKASFTGQQEFREGWLKLGPA